MLKGYLSKNWSIKVKNVKMKKQAAQTKDLVKKKTDKSDIISICQYKKRIWSTNFNSSLVIESRKKEKNNVVAKILCDI